MKTSLFEYKLPENLIANAPISPRDHSKLMVINRTNKTLVHKHFYDLADIFTDKDVLVFNQTKVFPARLIGQKPTGGKIEILLTKQLSSNTWQAIFKGPLKSESRVLFSDTEAQILEVKNNQVKLKFDLSDFWKWLYAHGQTPLPPYIKNKSAEDKIRTQYQTVYAKNQGSIAAPTAGFHFTQELLDKSKNKGTQLEYVTLHVGLGTFLPVKTDEIEKHKMHSEYFSLEHDTATRLNNAKKQGRRIISVGTTTTRVLESCSTTKGKLEAKTGKTNIFIYPPYKFRFVDSLVTNFHLPHSTLLALVSALVSYPNTDEKFENFGKSLMGKAYKEAIRKKYRFYSFGDSSIIL